MKQKNGKKNACELFVRNDLIKLTYREISLLDNDRKKIFYQFTLSKNEKRLHLSKNLSRKHKKDNI